MPHFGQVPGPICLTSGCIGQVYSAPGSPAGGSASVSAGARKRVGSASNFVLHLALQKR